MLDACRQARSRPLPKFMQEASAGVTLARLSLFWPPCRCLAPLGHQGYLPQSPGRCGDLWATYQEISKAKMLIIALLSAACGAHAAEERLTIASTFRPWALNDSQAFVFPRIAEKRNRGRRERLAATLRKDGDAIASALHAGVDWNSLGVAWPRGALRRLPAAFAALVAKLCGNQISASMRLCLLTGSFPHRWRTAAPTARCS